MAKKEKEQTKEEKNLARTLQSEMLKLSTSAFGLVAALAWNDLIKEVIAQYIKPFVGPQSSIISMLVYALIVTMLAVTVTYQLSRITKKKD